MFLTDVSMFNIWRDSKCMGWWTDVDLKKRKKKKNFYYRRNNQCNTFYALLLPSARCVQTSESEILEVSQGFTQWSGFLGLLGQKMLLVMMLLYFIRIFSTLSG